MSKVEKWKPRYSKDKQDRLHGLLRTVAEEYQANQGSGTNQRYTDTLIEIFWPDGDYEYFQADGGSLSGYLLMLNDQNPDLHYVDNIAEAIPRFVENYYSTLPSPDQPEYEVSLLVYKSLLDLRHDISIEATRIRQVYIQYKKTAQEAKDDFIKAQSQSTEAQQIAKKASATLKKSLEEATKIKTEMVTILSIFASIVLVFSGGFTILGNALASLHSVII